MRSRFWYLLVLLAITLSSSARAATVLAFVVQSPKGTGTGFLVKDLPEHPGTFIVTALHVLGGAQCAVAQPFPACSTLPDVPQTPTTFTSFDKCDQAVAASTLRLDGLPTLVWPGHDLVAIEVSPPSLPEGFVAGRVASGADLPRTARELFLQGAGASDACPNGDGRLRYYVQAGTLADWGSKRSKPHLKPSDFIGTLTAKRQLVVMSSTGSPGASGGPITTDIDSEEIVAMYQGGDGRGQATWGVVVTAESLRQESPVLRKFGDWHGATGRAPSFAHAHEDLKQAADELTREVILPSPSHSVELAALFEMAAASNPTYEVGGTFGVGGNVASWLRGIELWGAASFTHRFTNVDFEGPAVFKQAEPLQSKSGSGNAFGLEAGLHLRLTRRDSFPALSADALWRGRIVGEDGVEDDRPATTLLGATGPVVRGRACGDLNWAFGVCLGAGFALEYYRPTTYVYDGFGSVERAPRTWQFHPQLSLGIQYAP